MGGLQLLDAIDQQRKDQALVWHLRHNHYPPVHPSFIETAKKAIEAANRQAWDEKIDMPNGLTRSVNQIVDGLHLHDFLDGAGS